LAIFLVLQLTDVSFESHLLFLGILYWLIVSEGRALPQQMLTLKEK